MSMSLGDNNGHAHPTTGPACTGFAPALSLTTTTRIIHPNQTTGFSYWHVYNTEEFAYSHPLNTMVSVLAIYLSPYSSSTKQCLADPQLLYELGNGSTFLKDQHVTVFKFHY